MSKRDKLYFPSHFTLGPSVGSWFLLVSVTTFCISGVSSAPQLFTYRPADVIKSTSNGQFVIESGKETELILFGSGLTTHTIVKFSDDPKSCDLNEVDLIGGGLILLADNNSSKNNVQRATLSVHLSSSSSKSLYFCIFPENHTGEVIHQGSDPWLTIVVKPSILPLWVEIIFILILMVLSGLFSGLNLGLMSLDPTTLKIIVESGTMRQRIYAKIIYKVRKRGNYLLCTLLLGNVLVNSSLTILLDEVLPSGFYAILASTMTIVIFGEIIPQAICSRHGLVVGAWTIPLTLVFMFITFPISLPLSLILNFVLGKEIGAVYNRDQLLKLLHVTREHHDLENDEMDIIMGVLNYKKKMARDVMTKFDDIFCISFDSVLDFKTMKDIYESGFSRIPVYEDIKENIVHLLYVRDLAFVDPDDNTTLASHTQFYQHDPLFFFEDTPLDEILKGFLEGNCHLGVIQTIREVPDKDPVYEAVGVVTLEDIVEEILQIEIVDETDRFVDNRTFEPRKGASNIDVGEFMNLTNSLSPQQRLAVFKFLSTEVEPFTSKYMSGVVLKRLLTRKDIVHKLYHEEYKKKNKYLYTRGTPASFFCLILEGSMEVEIGKDGLKFESRSFSHFGAQALTNALQHNMVEYKPDFNVRPTVDCEVILMTSRQYLAARKASVFEGGRANTVPENLGGKDERSPRNEKYLLSGESTDMEVTQKALGRGSFGRFFSRSQNRQAKEQQRKKPDQQYLLSVDGDSEPPSPSINARDVRICLNVEEFGTPVDPQKNSQLPGPSRVSKSHSRFQTTHV